MRLILCMCLLLGATSCQKQSRQASEASEVNEVAVAPVSESHSPAQVETHAVTLNQREQQFKELLNGAKLNGSFTMRGKHQLDGLASDTYVIQNIDKVSEERWRFMVRIKYLSTDVTVPLFLPIKWAEDTAMVYVENMFVPGIGTYSARVLFDKNKYAGTWSGDGYGGHLFGDIEKFPAE